MIYRAAVPGVKIVVLATAHRAKDIEGFVPADAVVEPAEGIEPLVAAVRSFA